jgi:hypothetical protein
MSAFMCNDPGVIGYSVCCTRDVVAMHAHYPEEDVGDFYRRSQRFQAVWQYMPVDEGETVVEIWRRGARSFRTHSLALRTNKGRIAVMGEWPVRYGSGLLQNQNYWTLLNRMGEQPSRVFYEADYSGIGLLAFETPRPESGGQWPANLSPPSAGPDSKIHEPYYYTWSDLSGVTAVTPCQRQYGEKPVIRGLLLHHANAHVSCVGEVRLDSLGCRLEVEGSLWLGFSTDTRGKPCVTQIATSCPAEKGTVTWFALPCRGKLEWWFSFSQCRVYHEGRASPPTSDVVEVSRHSTGIVGLGSLMRRRVINGARDSISRRVVEVEDVAWGGSTRIL